ncbi:MAG TPA: glycosyltransferase family 39 protein, partial [Candidatus Thermoplasmatota archaeon]|nr:glycosyltransferase family 39 protein [Candidatus Thermoplasmatota archaeon]
YPPAYPFYLGVVFTIFGFGLWQAKIAAVVVALAALGAVYWCTRDLYGPLPAALATGLLALEPHLVWVTGTGFSENMVLLFFALTMWAILKSLQDDRYIVLAGLFAGLAYLSRASVGYFFVIAGAGGFLWRFYYKRWKVFTNVWYMLAIAVFVGIAGAWAWRNASLFPPVTQTLHLFGQTWTLTMPAWETSSYTRYVQNYAMERPEMWGHALVRKAPFFLAFLLWYVAAFLPESWRATKRIREEQTSALWLSVFLVWVIAWIISSMFWVFEQSSLYWFDNHRYVVIGLLPLGWLLLREAKLDRASTRLRVILLTLSLFAGSAAVFTDPIRYSDLRAAEFMDDHLRPGDEVGVDGGTIKYAFYPYLTHPEKIRIYGCEAFIDVATLTGPCHGAKDDQGNQADFVLTLRNTTYQGYTWVGDFKQRYSDGGVMTSSLYARDDVVQERRIPTGVVREWN